MPPSHDYQFLVPSFLHLVDRHAYKTWSVPSGERDFHNIMLIASGEGTAITNGEKQQLHSGMLVYHPVGESFGYETSEENLIHCLGGNFELSILRPGEQSLPFDRLPLDTYTTPPNFDRLFRLFTDLAQVWSNGGNDKLLRCRSIFLSILDEITHSNSLSIDEHKHLYRVHQVIRYMEEHYDRRITLAKLAELAGLNPSYFGQTFRQIKGMTPVQYLNSIRIDKALQAIDRGCSLSEASAKVGFNDPFYFSRVFKKKKGICPSEYVKQETYF